MTLGGSCIAKSIIDVSSLQGALIGSSKLSSARIAKLGNHCFKYLYNTEKQNINSPHDCVTVTVGSSVDTDSDGICASCDTDGVALPDNDGVALCVTNGVGVGVGVSVVVVLLTSGAVSGGSKMSIQGKKE